jgi:uncharacterized membrane protein YhhN
MGVAIGVTVGTVAVLVWAERVGSPIRLGAKPLASTGFVVVALLAGALDSAYGRWVLAALVLSWLGDVLLLGRARPLFLGGLVAFLLAHLAYSAAFGVRGISPAMTGLAAALAVLPAIVVLKWLRSYVDREMWPPVVAYTVVISAMVALAAGTVAEEWSTPILAGAVMFYLSDLFVARDRFVAPGWDNRLLGLPLYYAAQLLFATSTG